MLFTDTFDSGDSRRKYGQVFYDRVSRYGYVTAMRSKTEIGDAFADFCSQCWVPLILVRDNAGENIGGSIVQELRNRNVRSAFICLYRSQQNFAEGYIGRVTVMASFGMVFSGAPLFMWVHAIKAAAFINNITATFFAVPGCGRHPTSSSMANVFLMLPWWFLLGVLPSSCWTMRSKQSSRAAAC